MRNHMKFGFTAVLAVAFVAGCSENTSEPRSSAARLEADVRFLANDLLEGREAGTRGYDIAALFVAERFRALGLEPGGDAGGYFQDVPMIRYALGESADLTIGDVDLEAGVDYRVVQSLKGEAIDLSSGLVFGGMCFASERDGRDDFEGLDLDGKIVACMSGAPNYLNSEELAHYRNTQNQRISDRGAVGLVSVYTSAREAVFPFERLNKMLTPGFSRMAWLNEDGSPHTSAPNLQAGAIISLTGAEKLFANSGYAWEEILADADSDAGDVDRFDMGLNARIQVESRHSVLSSANVAAILPGSDPVLANEYVVLTAHLDHLGIRPTPEIGDDELHNGAMDNASGISALLEVARQLKASPPKRSVVFIALTAEEKGLVGSDYFARNPTVPASDMVAVVNLDMPIMSYDFTDIIAYGAERSTLFGPVEDAVGAHGLSLSPDPAPEQGIFTRSDHYMFVRQGVPAVYLKPGFSNGGEEAQNTFRTEHYHTSSDEVSLVNFVALRRFTDVKLDIARNIADMPERPLWNAGDFFGTTFGGPLASE